MSEQPGRRLGDLLVARRRHVLAVEHDVERRVGPVEGRRQVGRHPAQQLELEVGANLLRRVVGQDRVALAQHVEPAHDHHFAAGGQTQRPEVGIQVDMGQQLLHLRIGRGHEALGRIAQLERRELLLRHSRLDREHHLRRRARVRGLPAGDREVLGDLRDVTVADALGLRLEIVVETESQVRVADVDRHACAVLRMRRCQGCQHDAVAREQLQAGKFLGQGSRPLDPSNALELGNDRLHAEGFQPLDIHAGSVEVADPLRRRALGRRAARPRRLLQQVAQLRLDRLLHDEVAGNLQPVSGNLRCVQPAATRVAPEVLPRIGRGVHLRRRESEREAEVARSLGRRRRRSVGRLGRESSIPAAAASWSPQARRRGSGGSGWNGSLAKS